MGNRFRRSAAAAAFLALLGLVAYACLLGDEEHEALAPDAAALAVEEAAIPTAAVVSPPSPSGYVLQLQAPALVVQSCELTIEAQVTPSEVESALVSAELTVTQPGGGTLFAGPSTAGDPIAGTAIWELGRSVSEAWPAGSISITVTVMLANGERLAVSAAAEVVAMNLLMIEIDGATYQNGDTIVVPCTNPLPYPLQPTTPIGGYTMPGGGVVTCGPVLTYAQVLPPNQNGEGLPVLGLTTSPALSFTITIENPGEAQVEFQAPQVPGSTVVLTVQKPTQQAPPRVRVFIEGIIFNWDKGAGSRDALNVRMYARQNGARTDGAYPDDLLHAPLYRSSESELSAWLPEREDTRRRYRAEETLDDAPPRDLFSDSAAVYSARLTDPTRPLILHVLFRVDVEGVIPGNPASITIDVRASGPADGEFWHPEGQVNQVQFELRGSTVATHLGHQHSTDAAPEADQSNPGSLRHLRRHYVSFPTRIRAEAFRQYRFFDEELTWEYRDPFQNPSDWEPVNYTSKDGSVTSNRTRHRTYVLLDSPQAPWRLVPGRQEGEQNTVPADFNHRGGRDYLLTDTALPWLHVLDELLAPVQETEAEGFVGNGCVGGLGAEGPWSPGARLNPETQRAIARRTTIFIQRHDMDGNGDAEAINIPAPSGWFHKKSGELVRRRWRQRVVDRQNLGFARHFEWRPGIADKAPNEPRDQGFALSKQFFVLYSMKNRARFAAPAEAEAICTQVCYDLAAANKLFATLLGCPLALRIERESSGMRTPLQLWGVYVSSRDFRRRVIGQAEKQSSVDWHAFNVLDQGDRERVYDPLYLLVLDQGNGQTGVPLVGTVPIPPGGPLTVNAYHRLMFRDWRVPREISIRNKGLIIR